MELSSQLRIFLAVQSEHASGSRAQLESQQLQEQLAAERQLYSRETSSLSQQLHRAEAEVVDLRDQLRHLQLQVMHAING